jgi:hypothetical protein
MAQLQADNYLSIPGAHTPPARLCHHCGSPLTLFARFCGECGASGLNNGPKSVVNFASVQSGSPMQMPTLVPPSPQFDVPNGGLQFPHSDSAQFITNQSNKYVQPNAALAPPPNFAKVNPQLQHVDPTLKAELDKQEVLLARERFFLYTHCIIFLCVNLFGFWLSLKAYNEYNADELTKGIISLTPLLFINSVALVTLSPIKNTKQQIHRLKEKIKFLRIQIEYRNIF